MEVIVNVIIRSGLIFSNKEQEKDRIQKDRNTPSSSLILRTSVPYTETSWLPLIRSAWNKALLPTLESYHHDIGMAPTHETILILNTPEKRLR